MKQSQYLIFFCILTLTISHDALAVPKSTPCKQYKTNVCVDKSTISRDFRSSLPKSTKYLTPLQVFPMSGAATTFPPNSDHTARPEVLIPAGTETITVCQIRAGKFECTVLSKFKDCPTAISLRDADSGISYECQVDCDNRNPSGHADSNGNCDCDVLYNTCQ